MIYPEEKLSNNPYANWMQPSDEAPSLPQQQDHYQAPSGPPPAYTQHDATSQAYNPQVQAYQSQLYQTRPGPTASQYGVEYPSCQQRVPGVRNQHSAGPSYALHEPSSLNPYGQTPGTGPTSSRPSPPNDEHSSLSLASFFGNTGPPPMWQRQPVAHLPYDQFPPMCLISNGKELGKGFPEVPPPSQVRPHPFATHDVAEEDWKRFLADVKKAGSLSGGQRIKSNAIPLLAGASLIGGFMLTSAIEKRMKAKNRSAAGDVIDHWNYYFFGPRRMEAVLCQGSERLSGCDGVAPLGDPNRHQNNRASSCSSSSSSSDSDDNMNQRHGHGVHASQGSYKSDKKQRRAERKIARTQRRQEKRARKQERRAGKACGNNRELYQIFIQPQPATTY